MELKEPIKEKISKFWNRPNPETDLGILGAAAKGLFKGALTAIGAMGRQKSTYDISLSSRYFCNQNKPEFGSIQRENAQSRENEKRSSQIKKASTVSGKTILLLLKKYNETLQGNLNGFEITFDTVSADSDVYEISLGITYQTKVIAQYTIEIEAK